MSFYLFCQVSKDLSAKYLFVEGKFKKKNGTHMYSIIEIWLMYLMLKHCVTQYVG